LYKSPNESSDWTVSTEELKIAKKNNQPLFGTLNERFEYYLSWISRETLSTSLISSTGLGIILLVTAIALYFCWRCKRARDPNDTNNRIDALQLKIRRLGTFTITELEMVKEKIFQKKTRGVKNKKNPFLVQKISIP
jgi:hypothetical protein